MEHKKFWFKRKQYGWGWYPSSWEGWLVLAVYAGLLVKQFIYIDVTSHSDPDTAIAFILPVIVSTAILIGVCFWKGETPRWQWGEKTKKKTVIGITGTIGSGKDTVAKYIGDKLGIPVMEISKYIKDKVREAGQEMTRLNVMDMGYKIAHEEGEDIIAKKYLEIMGDMAVISGFRQLAQIDYLEKNSNLILIAVDADPQVRFDRVHARGTVKELPTLEKFVEHELHENSDPKSPMRLFECIKRAKFHIVNNSTLEDLYKNIDEVLKISQFSNTK